ncbi:MAG: hypothetical protein FWG10_01835 [Eubacteriaceae bacterium]|nr:hypothetical protein [Eubacteriaceae bacterium]
MMKRIKEWVSVKRIMAPRLIVLLSVIIANVVFIAIAALVMSLLAPASLENRSVGNIAFNLIAMILGVGGTETVIEDIGTADFVLVVACITSVIIGLVVFTGTIIGYMSELISNFIENASSSSLQILVSDHVIILNWNNRAAELIAELYYKNKHETVIILADEDREEIQRDIDERLDVAIEDGIWEAQKASAHMGWFGRRRYIAKNVIKNKLDVIVREGEPWSSKQLYDISLEMAKTVFLLGRDYADSEESPKLSSSSSTASLIKTLALVAQIREEEQVGNDQQVIVEIDDKWTDSLVGMVIKHKVQLGTGYIVPVDINQLLGQIFSQFSIMPELNVVYNSLISNKSATFFTRPIDSQQSEHELVASYLGTHLNSIPLGVLDDTEGERYLYIMANDETGLKPSALVPAPSGHSVSINPEYYMKEKHVVIFGSNSKSNAIMEGYSYFCSEWSNCNGYEPLEVTIIDTVDNLSQMGNYSEYSFVKKVVATDAFDKSFIAGVLDEMIDSHTGDKCILILSDDTVPDEDIDSNAITYLILVQDVLYSRQKADPDFDIRSIDMVVEILDPQNFDAASNYSVENIIVSNRYLSKTMMQIGEKRALFEFYFDIFTYDEDDEFNTKEIYIKRVDEFFTELPKPSSAADLIRSVYYATPDSNKAILLGYFTGQGQMVLFSGDQSKTNVAFTGDEKVVVYMNH